MRYLSNTAVQALSPFKITVLVFISAVLVAQDQPSIEWHRDNPRCSEQIANGALARACQFGGVIVTVDPHLNPSGRSSSRIQVAVVIENTTKHQLPFFLDDFRFIYQGKKTLEEIAPKDPTRIISSEACEPHEQNLPYRSLCSSTLRPGETAVGWVYFDTKFREGSAKISIRTRTARLDFPFQFHRDFSGAK
jgi:hypothetical protein